MTSLQDHVRYFGWFWTVFDGLWKASGCPNSTSSKLKFPSLTTCTLTKLPIGPTALRGYEYHLSTHCGSTQVVLTVRVRTGSAWPYHQTLLASGGDAADRKRLRALGWSTRCRACGERTKRVSVALGRAIERALERHAANYRAR